MTETREAQTPRRVLRRPTAAARRTEADDVLPRHPWRIVLVSAAAGFVLTVLWSAPFVDRVIGGTVADTLLGHDADTAAITGFGAGVIFAFVSGLAGTVTACNVAAFAAVAPVIGSGAGRWSGLRQALKPLGWLSLGMVGVSAAYGAVVGVVGTDLPQFSTAPFVPGSVSPRLGQAMVVFGVVGAVMVVMGLAALGLVRDPFGGIARRHPNAPVVIMGMLIGGFLIGRPFPLFRVLFRDAAERGNPLYGAAVFSLQSLANIVVVGVVVLALTAIAGPRLRSWAADRPDRVAAISAAGLIVAGVFTVLYWDVRLLAVVDVLPWYPVAPWV